MKKQTWTTRIRTLKTYVAYDPVAQEIWAFHALKKDAVHSAKVLGPKPNRCIVVHLTGTFAFPMPPKKEQTT